MNAWWVNLPAALLLLAVAAGNNWALEAHDRWVREDGIVEWATFFAFVAAGLVYARSSIRRSGPGLSNLKWFAAGLALFCAFVALEEISWGQRLFGYQPPEAFLAQNAQQELNFHNAIDDDLRQDAFLAIVLGYGAALPWLVLIPAIGRRCSRLGIEAPAIALTPTFLITGALYFFYPWSLTGEWCELMLGVGLLSAGLGEPSSPPLEAYRTRAVARTLGVVGFVCVLGGLTAWIGSVRASSPEQLVAAEAEVAALGLDFASARTRTRCGIHKRVFTFIRDYDQGHLLEGQFAVQTRAAGSDTRADFFIDPWNSPYWIRHACTRDRNDRAVFVYSFGPNRIRDSTDWEILGDDLGAWVSRPERPRDQSDID